MRTRSTFGALASAGALFLALGTPSDVEAQQLHLGGQASYGTESYSELGVGAFGTYLFAENIAGAGSFNYHFPGDNISFWDFNANVHYRFDIDAGITPYAGGGLNYSNISVDVDVPGAGAFGASSSEVGLNVLGGAFTDLDNGIRIFGEGRFVISDADQLVLSVGLGIPLGE